MKTTKLVCLHNVIQISKKRRKKHDEKNILFFLQINLEYQNHLLILHSQTPGNGGDW